MKLRIKEFYKDPPHKYWYRIWCRIMHTWWNADLIYYRLSCGHVLGRRKPEIDQSANIVNTMRCHVCEKLNEIKN